MGYGDGRGNGGERVTLLRALVELQYRRNDQAFARGEASHIDNAS